ncbi:hypothetical protein PHLCEN_2v6594, partial [Hermanssonia centrifuga]
MSSRPRRLIKPSGKVKDPNNVAEREEPHKKQHEASSLTEVPSDELDRLHLDLPCATSTTTTTPSVPDVNDNAESEMIQNPKARHLLVENSDCDESPAAASTDKPFIVHDSDSESSASDSELAEPDSDKPEETHRTKRKKKQQKTKAAKRPRQSKFDEVANDGFLKDIDVQEIPKPTTAKSQDNDHFFGPPELRKGGVYRKWALENDFESKLPNDIKKRKEAHEKALDI